jgi:nanoRNase/pAp phosphatase (c-di-AMP/oligoRNAs hydrolase)
MASFERKIGGRGTGMKQSIRTLRKKHRIMDNIIAALADRQGFVVLGHGTPDEDCLASMVAFALLSVKFSKPAAIYLGKPVHEHFQYLLNICTYNSIGLLYQDDPLPAPADTLVLCDTAKPDMIEANAEICGLIADPRMLKVEIDHHVGGDSAYFGDEGYRLVTEASSSGELIGQLVLRLRGRKHLLRRFQIHDLLSRNIILAVLTGIIGDSKMGAYLKSRRERRYYRMFSTMFNRLLTRRTYRTNNFANMSQVFDEIERLSDIEKGCYSRFYEQRRRSERFGYVIIGEKQIEELCRSFGADTIVSVARALTDRLAYESGCLGLVCYADDPGVSDLVQFRIRRSQHYRKFDLRRILEEFSFQNGGGHQGAIGFRIPKSQIESLTDYVVDLIAKVEALVEREEKTPRL